MRNTRQNAFLIVLGCNLLIVDIYNWTISTQEAEVTKKAQYHPFIPVRQEKFG
jgi:hypothetical protein